MKTKEQVLAVVGLTARQRERAEAFFQAQERFHKPLTMDVNTAQEVKEKLNAMIEAYDKRKAAEARSKERKEAKKAEYDSLVELVKDATNYGFTFEDVVQGIRNMIKERKNEEINAKIAELQAQLID